MEDKEFTAKVRYEEAAIFALKHFIDNAGIPEPEIECIAFRKMDYGNGRYIFKEKGGDIICLEWDDNGIMVLDAKDFWV